MPDAAPVPAVAQSRVWRPGRPVPVALILGAVVRGAGDPSHRVQPDGVLWRATRTPQGPALLRLHAVPAAGTVEALAWGAGAGWVLDGVPDLLGERDDPDRFVPLAEHPRLEAALRARPGWRVARTRAVFEALVPAVLEQRVTGLQARASYRALVREYGDVAPGPGGDRATYAYGMRVPPAPADWARIPSWAWLRAGVEQARSSVVLAAAAVAGRLEETLELTGSAPGSAGGSALGSAPGSVGGSAPGSVGGSAPGSVGGSAPGSVGGSAPGPAPGSAPGPAPGPAPGWGEAVAARLRVVPGVGVWTAAEIRQRAHGDPDAFSWNDFHVAKNVTWALTGQVGDDAACARLIEPYRGHRYRVQRLLELDGAARPRRAPRITLPTHLPRVPR